MTELKEMKKPTFDPFQRFAEALTDYPVLQAHILDCVQCYDSYDSPTYDPSVEPSMPQKNN